MHLPRPRHLRAFGLTLPKSIPGATAITLTAGKHAGRSAQHWKRRLDLFEVACGLITVGAHPNAGAEVLADVSR